MIGAFSLLLSTATALWLALTPQPVAAQTATTPASAPPDAAAKKQPGPVFAVGGGQTPPKVLRRMLSASRNGKNASIVVFPQASKKSDGSIDQKQWLAAGARTVTPLLKLTKNRKFALEQIAAADIIWFGGGAQRRLMDALKEAKLTSAIRAAHHAGAVVGGTSAGAAVLSHVMISGRSKYGLRRGMPTYRGLGLWPQVAIDQHFVARRRFGRLLNAVVDPGAGVRLGIGIGEDTAAVWWPKRGDIEVMGDGSVVVYDARQSVLPERRKGTPMSARGVHLHVLTQGQRWSLSQLPDKP